MIVQKNISKIPLKLPYICGTIKEQVKNIYDSKIVDTDLLKIGINNGYQQVISGPMAYISTITVGYVPNKEFYSIFGDGTPSSIYNLKMTIGHNTPILFRLLFTLTTRLFTSGTAL